LTSKGCGLARAKYHSRLKLALRLTLISIGKDRSGFFEPGVQEYVGRLSRVTKVSLVQLPESGHTGARAKADEAAAILKKVPEGDVLVALDERGKSLSSTAFAQWLGRQRDAARNVCCVVGGDEGLAEEVTAQAALTLSLSAMTLPHRLARLMLAEQLYRAFSILRGEPYHK
jgi:23S rRNA (pseudouridine1915-N3)-methyltransferase